MAENEIKTGDLVWLKSGGPKMTVTNVGTPMGKRNVSAWCSWFEGKKSENGVFALESLTKIDPATES